MNYRLLEGDELKAFCHTDTFYSKACAFYQQQIAAWPLCKNGVSQLDALERRELLVAGDKVILQCNPQRIKSVAAKVSPSEIKARPCFLCANNLPIEQKAIKTAQAAYVLLCNPMPIFRQHFTVVHVEHRAQHIEGEELAFLEIARQLGPKMLVFFNGARAGASAPDHHHFQAAPADSFPIFDVLAASADRLFGAGRLSEFDSVPLSLLPFAGVSHLCLQSASAEKLCLALRKIVRAFSLLQPGAGDLINVVARFDGAVWQVLLMLRTKLRPERFYEEGEKQLLISPASVEMCGVVVTPRVEDFNKVTAQDIEAIYKEVSVEENVLREVAHSVVKFK